MLNETENTEVERLHYLWQQAMLGPGVVLLAALAFLRAVLKKALASSPKNWHRKTQSNEYRCDERKAGTAALVTGAVSRQSEGWIK